MNYLQWNNAIIDHFFNVDNEEREVTLYFSEKIIGEIGVNNFEKPEDGYLEDFFKALRIGVSGTMNTDYIKRIIDLETRFVRGTLGIAGDPFNYPPYLSYLLAFILPFTSGDIQEGFSMNNFHGIAKKYFEGKRLTGDYNKFISNHLKEIDYLWDKLNNWLIEKNDFSLGYIEEINDPNPSRKYVSKYEYHILFRKEQEERLSKVFDNNNIIPDDAITEEQIRNLLIENSSFLRLSTNTKDKIKQNDYIGDKIVKRALKFYKNWTGITHIVEGHRGYSRIKLVLCLDFNTLNPRLNFKYFRALTKDALPENSTLEKSNGELINDFYQNRELYSNPINNCFIDLKSEIELKDQIHRVKYNWKAKEFYLFKRIDHLDWVEITKVEFNVGKTLIICTDECYENTFKEWFESISGTKKLYKDSSKTLLNEGWLAFFVENITKFPHQSQPEFIPTIEENPKINFDKEFYANGLIFKDILPSVWIENYENYEPITAIYEDGSEIILTQDFIIEKDEDGNEFEALINKHSFTAEHIEKNDQAFKLNCSEINSLRFLKIVDFKKLANDIIESNLPKRNSIGQIENIEKDYTKGLEHFFSDEKVQYIKIRQEPIKGTDIFKNNIDNKNYKKGLIYDNYYLGNILLNYISTKGKLSKSEFDQAIFKLLEKSTDNQDIKKKANALRFQLQDSGYVDYNGNTSCICANKPHLVIKPTDLGTTAILVGARDNIIVGKIIQYCEDNSITISIKNENDELFPQIIHLKFKSFFHSKVKEFADTFGLIFKKSGLYTQSALAYHFNDISKWKEYIQEVENSIEDFEGGDIFDIKALKYKLKLNEFDKHLAFVKFTEISGFKTICRLWHQGVAYDISNQQFGIYLYLFLFREMTEEKYKKSIEEKGWINCREELEEKENAPKLTNILLYDKNRKYLAVPIYCRLPRFFSMSIALLNGRKADVKYLKIENVRHKGMYLIYKNVPSLFVNNIFVNLKQQLNYTEILL